jgi:hypothetical protein
LNNVKGAYIGLGTLSPHVVLTVDNWANYFTPAALTNVKTAYSPNGDYLLALEAGGVYRSADDGATKSLVLARQYTAVAFHNDNLTVYAGTGSGYIGYSTDGGINWTEYQVDRRLGISIVHVAQAYGSANVIRTGTSWKALSLWDADHNDSPPDGWRNIAFDDSAWGVAVQDTAPGNPIIAGTQAIWPSVPPADDTEQCCLRKTFTGPSGVVTAATLQVNADDVADVWINNVFIGRASGAGTTHTFSVPPAAILPGATNAIAVLAANTTGRAWVSAKLEVS